MVERACKSAGVHKIRVHDLRSSHATYTLANKSKSAYNLMASCGWKSLEMVQRYLRVSIKYTNEKYLPDWMGIFAFWATFGQLFNKGKDKITRNYAGNRTLTLVEQRFRKAQAVGSNPIPGSIYYLMMTV